MHVLTRESVDVSYINFQLSYVLRIRVTNECAAVCGVAGGAGTASDLMTTRAPIMLHKLSCPVDLTQRKSDRTDGHRRTGSIPVHATAGPSVRS